MYVTEEELEYYSNPILNSVNEATFPYKPEMSFEEELKAYNCITIDEFSDKIGEAIRRLIPTT